MSKSVVLNLGSGDLNNGFPQVIARVWLEGNALSQQFIASLPPAPHLVQQYHNWQLIYQNVCSRIYLRSSLDVEEEDDELEINQESGITNVSIIDFNEASLTLQHSINEWLKSLEFLHIEQQLRSQLNPKEEVRVIIETNDETLRRLVWHRWDFFNDYPYAEVALSQPEYSKRETLASKPPRNQVRILAILGNSLGIDLEKETKFLNSLQDAEVVFLVKPSRMEFNTHLWDSAGWDILFFAGHSQTEGETGRIYINENQTNNSLTIEQLEEALKAAIDKGLQLAIFNSCDGLGLATALEKLNIPTVIVMREPVPNRIAQDFFQYFLNAFAVERLPLYISVKEARRKLQGLEDDFPGASWLPVICQNPAVEPPSWLKLGGIPPSPYRGLFAFREEDAHLFFGREQCTLDLVEAVKRKPLVALVGASGSGKSSVVFAGLIPKLRQDTNVNWQILSFRPGKNPFEAMAVAFASITTLKNNQRLRELELETELRYNEANLCQLIESILTPHRPHFPTLSLPHSFTPPHRLVLIVDQFEELYTLCPEKERLPFLNALLTAVKLAPGFTLVITLRADFYGYALSYRPLSDALQGRVINNGPMSREELQLVIEKPAEKMQVRLENGLTNKLIDAVEGESGNLPLLEFALTQLWSKQSQGLLTHQGYFEIGGVESAISTHAEAVYTQLSAADRLRAQQVFMQLVCLREKTEATRRLATRDEVKSENWDLVTRLASSRLVVTNRNEFTNEETVELVHEALIRSWGRLEEWIRVDGEFRYWQERLRAIIREWEKSGFDEGALLRGKPLSDAQYWQQQRHDELSFGERSFIERSLEMQKRELNKASRRRRLTIFGLSGGLVLALGLAGIAWWNSQNSANSEIKALSQSSQAQFDRGNRMDGLVEAIRTGQKLKKLSFVPTETQMQVKLVLRQTVYMVRERNRLLGHLDNIKSVNFSPDGKTIASGSEDGTIKLWSWDGRLQKTLKEHQAAVNQVSFSPDGKAIASASDDKTIKLWRSNGELLKTIKEHQAAVNQVSFSPDGKTIASASDDKTIKLWNFDGRLVQTLSGHSSAVKSVTISPDGKTIASGSDDKSIKLWSWEGKLLKTLNKHTGAVNSVSFSPDSKTIASGSSDTTIKLWRRDGELLNTLNEHTKTVSSVTFSPDGKTIASAGWDESVRLWSQDGVLVQNLWGHNNKVNSVSFSSDSLSVASGSEDNTIRLWNVNGEQLQVLNYHKKPVNAISISRDGKTIASASSDHTIKIWDQDGRLLQTLKGHTGKVTSVSFSPDGKTFASSSTDKTIILWNRDGQLLKTFTAHRGEVTSVEFSPDGKTLASGSTDKTIKLWNLDTQQSKHLSQHQAAVRSLSFNPDGKILVSGGDDARIIVWNLDTHKPKTIISNTGSVTWVTFSSDGKTIASASSDDYIKLWNLDGQTLSSLRGHDNANIRSVSFSPDNNTLVSAGADNKIIFWNLNVDDLLLRGCNWLNDYLNNPTTNKDIHHLCADFKA
jgi:WD40 repeat protein